MISLDSIEYLEKILYPDPAFEPQKRILIYVNLGSLEKIAYENKEIITISATHGTLDIMLPKSILQELFNNIDNEGCLQP
ncbi:MAG: hypothetical protein QXY58_01980 [Nitrososphaerota archaeon]